MTPHRCLIIDDEPPAVALLTDYVGRLPEWTLAGAYTDPVAALQFLRRTPVDLLLLDVQMPELNGLQLARIVGDECRVILTTAYDAYALAGYELDVVDYLLKPISFERFRRAVVKARLPADGPAPARRRPDHPSPPPAFIFVKSGRRTHRVALDELRYGSSDGDYLSLFRTDGSRLLTLENISELVARLPPDRFCRIHRSHFVALDKIDFVERRRVVVNGHYLPISDSYQEAFWARIG